MPITTRNLNDGTKRSSSRECSAVLPTRDDKPHKCLEEGCTKSFGKPKQLRDHLEAHNKNIFGDETAGIMEDSNNISNYNNQDGFEL